MKKKLVSFFLFLCLSLSFLCGVAACGTVPDGNTDRYSDPGTEAEQSADPEAAGWVPEAVTLNEDAVLQMDFGLRMLRDAANHGEGENILISPFSLSMALSMAANGAGGETAAQFDRVLGGTAAARNQFLKEYTEYLRSPESRFDSSDEGVFQIANAVWYRPDLLRPSDAFLQTAETYYGAGAHPTSFDAAGVKAVNDWVKEATLGQISDLVSEFPKETPLLLVNALGFAGYWTNQNTLGELPMGEFTSASGEIQSVQWLTSRDYTYFEINGGAGFFRSIRGHYSFVGILPPRGVSVEEFVNGLSARALLTAMGGRNGGVDSKIPKFSYSSDADFDRFLRAEGLTDAYDGTKADFSALGKSEKPLFLQSVRQKNTVEVNEYGVKFAAATSVVYGAGMNPDPRSVILDRPFVFFIVDDRYHLPLLAGIVNSVEASA